MQRVSAAIDRLGSGLAAIGAIVGFVVHGLESSGLWALIGYFLGKAMQSICWTIAGERTT